jgi:hypothetical protein
MHPLFLVLIAVGAIALVIYMMKKSRQSKQVVAGIGGDVTPIELRQECVDANHQRTESQLPLLSPTEPASLDIKSLGLDRLKIHPLAMGLLDEALNANFTDSVEAQRSQLMEFIQARDTSGAAEPLVTEPPNQPSLGTNFSLQLMCISRSQWRFGLIQLSSSLSQNIVSAHQNSTALKKEDDCWLLQDLFSPVHATTADGQELTINLRLPDKAPTAFKLYSNNSIGKRVSEVRDGEYLILAPADWTRADEISGPAGMEPESIDEADLKVHYFSIEKEGVPVAFKTNTGELILLGGMPEGFDLRGHIIPDENESLGILFGHEMPSIMFANPMLIQRNSSIKVLRNEDNTSSVLFQIDLSSGESIHLSSRMSEARSGLYKIELSDPSGLLVQSSRFRFCSGLTAVAIATDQDFSESVLIGGRRPVIELHHDSTSNLTLQENSRNRFLIERTSIASKIFDELPRPDNMLSLDYLDASGCLVPLKFLLPGLWWHLSDSESTEAGTEIPWTDSALTVSSKLLKASSKAIVFLKLPSKRWTSRIFAGVSCDSMRPYRPFVDESVVRIKLQDFCDFKELETPGSYPLLLKLERAGRIQAYNLGTVKVHCLCRLCERECQNTTEAIAHIVEKHTTELFSPISEQRKSELTAGLPDAVYHCQYCDTDLVVKHFEKPDVIAARHLKVSCHGCTKSDTDLPRLLQTKAEGQNAIANMKICQVCKSEFDGRDYSAMASHYTVSHKGKVLKIID